MIVRTGLLPASLVVSAEEAMDTTRRLVARSARVLGTFLAKKRGPSDSERTCGQTGSSIEGPATNAGGV